MEDHNKMPILDRLDKLSERASDEAHQLPPEQILLGEGILELLEIHTLLKSELSIDEDNVTEFSNGTLEILPMAEVNGVDTTFSLSKMDHAVGDISANDYTVIMSIERNGSGSTVELIALYNQSNQLLSAVRVALDNKYINVTSAEILDLYKYVCGYIAYIDRLMY